MNNQQMPQPDDSRCISKKLTSGERAQPTHAKDSCRCTRPLGQPYMTDRYAPQVHLPAHTGVPLAVGGYALAGLHAGSQRDCMHWGGIKKSHTASGAWQDPKQATAQGCFWMMAASLDCAAVMEPVQEGRGSTTTMIVLGHTAVQWVCCMLPTRQWPLGHLSLADSAAATEAARLSESCLQGGMHSKPPGWGSSKQCADRREQPFGILPTHSTPQPTHPSLPTGCQLQSSPV